MATVTDGRAILLRAASEEDFARWVKRKAHQYGWHGVHIRWSQGVLESVHSVRQDGYSEAFGLPDWLFWNERFEQSFWAELKSWSGRETVEQKRQIASLRKSGLAVFVWRPQDEVEIEHVFREGL